MTDNEVLKSRARAMMMTPTDRTLLKACVAQVDKCQNASTHDGSVVSKEWYATRDLVNALRAYQEALEDYSSNVGV